MVFVTVKLTVTVYMLLLLSSSFMPMDNDLGGLNILMDMRPDLQNLLHIPAFGILAALWMHLLGKNGQGKWKKIGAVCLIGVCFGFLSEALQVGIPGRYPGLNDFVFDVIGILLGISLYLAIKGVYHNLVLPRR